MGTGYRCAPGQVSRIVAAVQYGRRYKAMSNPLKIAALIVAALFVLPHAARARAKDAGPARLLFDSANRERAARHLPPLRWDDHLAAAARRHARLMARHDAISHQFRGEEGLSLRTRLAGAHFTAVAENVAEGGTAAIIHSMWMKSPPHRANLLDPELDSLGVAVAESHGYLFAVEDFSQAAEDLSLEEQQIDLKAELQARGIRVVGDAAAARQACDGRFTRDISYRRAFMLRYSTTDLAKVPGLLEQKIHSGLFRGAVVGACVGSAPEIFSQYRVAVLLYE